MMRPHKDHGPNHDQWKKILDKVALTVFRFKVQSLRTLRFQSCSKWCVHTKTMDRTMTNEHKSLQAASKKRWGRGLHEKPAQKIDRVKAMSSSGPHLGMSSQIARSKHNKHMLYSAISLRHVQTLRDYMVEIRTIEKLYIEPVSVKVDW